MYHLENHMKETKEWYDGYRFGGVDVYCPWDVINHVDQTERRSRRQSRSHTGSIRAETELVKAL